jgi:hypothetical protein
MRREEHAGRSTAGHDSAQGAQLLARLEHRAQGRPQRDGRHLQIIVEQGADIARIARAQGREQSGVLADRCLGDSIGDEAISLRIDLGRRQLPISHGDDPVQFARGEDRSQHVAASRTQSGATQ